MNPMDWRWRRAARLLLAALAMVTLVSFAPDVLAQTPSAQPAPAHQAGGEASLKIPDLSQATFVGLNGRSLLMGGLAVCVLGLLFGLVIYGQLKNLPVHASMLEISELIYE